MEAILPINLLMLGATRMPTNTNKDPNNMPKQGKTNQIRTNHACFIYGVYGHYTHHFPHLPELLRLKEAIEKARANPRLALSQTILLLLNR